MLYFQYQLHGIAIAAMNRVEKEERTLQQGRARNAATLHVGIAATRSVLLGNGSQERLSQHGRQFLDKAFGKET